MLRYDRPRFIAFGLLPAVNALALLLYGLYATTGGSSKEGGLIPAIVVLAAALLLWSLAAAVKRGRDLGVHAAVTVLAFVVATGLRPAVLLVLGYLTFARSRAGDESFGPPPPRASPLMWIVGGLAALLPWAVLAVLVRVN